MFLSTIKNRKQQNVFTRRQVIRLVGSLSLLIFLWKLNINVEVVGQTLIKSNFVLVILAIGLIVPIVFLKARRWQLLLKIFSIQLSYKEAIKLYALGLSFGSFTPAQSGDFIKALYLQQAGYSLGSVSFTVVIDRLFDLLLLIVLCLVGLVWLTNHFSAFAPIVAITSLGMLGVALLVIIPGSRRFLVTKFISKNWQTILLQVQTLKSRLWKKYQTLTSVLPSSKLI
jgi:uncharacterized protein (TIRG00374 family)